MTTTWKFGDVTVTAVVETVIEIPPQLLMPASTAEGLGENREWLVPDFVTEAGDLRLSVHSFLINSKGKRIVVDTGLGSSVPEALAAFAVPGTRFLDDLAAAGFEREVVDYVVNTHVHTDHVGWNTMSDGNHRVPTFPNARYLLTTETLSAWKRQDPVEVASDGLAHHVQVPLDAGQVEEVDLDHQLTSEVRLRPTPGHTRGHVAIEIMSKGEHAIITGDLSHNPIQWAFPEWSHEADFDPAQSTQTRRHLLEEYADSATVFLGTHYPYPTAGTLVRNGTGARFRPLTVVR